MQIKGKVHCFFEQSGTFKNEFIKLGIPAEDYDIQNNFGQTDHVVDLFENIQNAYEGGASLFDNITNDDLILAFFPCIYFCAFSQVAMNWGYVNYKLLTIKEKSDKILERSTNRERFFCLAVKMVTIAEQRNLKLVMENPWSMQTFLKNGNFVKAPDVVDNDRTIRGDFFKKPTAYWFFGCSPTQGKTIQITPKEKIKSVILAKKSKEAGICSEERSMISPDYARNFICDFILGKKQQIGQLSLF